MVPAGRLRTEVYTQEIKDLLHSEENRLRGTVRVADEESKFDVESRMVDALHSIVGRYGNDTDDVEGMVCYVLRRCGAMVMVPVLNRSHVEEWCCSLRCVLLSRRCHEVPEASHHRRRL